MEGPMFQILLITVVGWWLAERPYMLSLNHDCLVFPITCSWSFSSGRYETSQTWAWIVAVTIWVWVHCFYTEIIWLQCITSVYSRILYYYWISGLWPLSGIAKRSQHFKNCICYHPQVERWEYLFGWVCYKALKLVMDKPLIKNLFLAEFSVDISVFLSVSTVKCLWVWRVPTYQSFQVHVTTFRTVWKFIMLTV